MIKNGSNYNTRTHSKTKLFFVLIQRKVAHTHTHIHTHKHTLLITLPCSSDEIIHIINHYSWYGIRIMNDIEQHVSLCGGVVYNELWEILHNLLTTVPPHTPSVALQQ